jgi:hypothetical protein
MEEQEPPRREQEVPEVIVEEGLSSDAHHVG